MQNNSWDIARSSGREGTGNWDAYTLGMDPIYKAAEKWKQKLEGVQYPWLCWNMNDEWCKVQQRLILDAGWTPVIGWDPNSCPVERTVLPGAIEINFNEDFGFSAMWSHFPLEFAFLWTERLAFWHSDLLVDMKKLKPLADKFKDLKAHEMSAVKSTGGLKQTLFQPRMHRYWELIGCTTKEASQHQFETGCGWWRGFYKHPNTPAEELEKRSRYYYDSGVGIMYWKKNCGGIIHNIPEKLIEEGHCTQIGNKKYLKAGSKSEELSLNFNLVEVATRLNIDKYL